MRLQFSPKSASDLEEIGDYIARDSPERAVSFVQELRVLCRRAADQPSAFPEREDLAPGVRMAVHGNYLILFRTLNDAVRIERIIHGARSLRGLV